MLHDIIILFTAAVVAYFSSLMCYASFRPERFQNKMEWWKAEGILIFLLALVVLLILALTGHFFHTLR